MRLEQLTFTRFIAAMAIVVFHFGSGAYPFNIPELQFIVHQAYLGVSYFFILSGFIMVVAYGSYEKIDPAVFLKNRLARIYPLLFLSVALLFLHTYLFDPAFRFGIIKDAVLNLSLLQAWIPSKVLLFNGPAWSLSVEFFFYLIFPFLYNLVFSRKSLRTIAIVIILFWIIFQTAFFYLVKSPFNEGYPSPNHALLFYSPFMHLSAFLAGNLGGLLFIKKFSGKTRNYDVAVILCATLLLLLLKYPTGMNYHNGLLAVVLIPFLLFMALNNGLITRLFNIRALVFLGEISFGIYILQIPVFRLTQSIVMELNITHDPKLLFYISAVVLILFSALSYLFFEKPLRNCIKRIKLNS